MRRLIPALLTLLLLPLAASPAAAQRGEVYCHVTEITSEQLSNGVRVTIQADGELHWHMDWWALLEQGAVKGEVFDHNVYIWGLTEKFRRLPFHIQNARSKLGSGFVAIDKYPVSHAEIYIPEWAHEGVGLEIDIVNYLGWLTGEGNLQRFRGDWYIQSSEGSDAIIILWESDRFPAPPPPKTPEDHPSELDVTEHDGLLTLRAVNAKLQDVTNAIAREAGLGAIAPPDDDLRVSVFLDDISPERALAAVATGCGLCARPRPGGGWTVAHPTGTAAGYGAAGSRRIPLRHLSALDALDLLPNFLLRYIHADEESNAIVATGPDFLLDRVAEDLAKLDLAPPEVVVDVVAVEYTSSEDISRALRLERFADDFAAGLDSLAGDLRFLWLEGLPEGWNLLLDNLEVETSTWLRFRATARVLNGHQAYVHAGQRHFVIFEHVEETFSEAYLDSIWTTSMISLQPLVGDGDEVVLSLGVVVRSMRGTDPRTGLPIVALRRANGVARVRDGETIVLAGLRMEEESREDRAVPMLGDLPLVGGLFRASHRSRSETQLAIFLTPHIIRQRLAAKGGPQHG